MKFSDGQSKFSQVFKFAIIGYSRNSRKLDAREKLVFYSITVHIFTVLFYTNNQSELCMLLEFPVVENCPFSIWFQQFLRNVYTVVLQYKMSVKWKPTFTADKVKLIINSVNKYRKVLFVYKYRKYPKSVVQRS